MKLHNIYQRTCDHGGSVLMEFILVAPIYLALWGGLFTIGELMLLNNRIAVADRNFAYLIPYLEKSNGEEKGKILKVVIALTGRNVSKYDEADLGYTKQSPVPNFKSVSMNNDRIVTHTDWGNMYATSLTVGGVEFPAFINGMIAAISLLSGDPVRNEDFIHTAGALAPSQLGRHYLLERISNVEYRTGDSENGLMRAWKVSMENVLGNSVIQDTDSSLNKNIVQNYPRLFGNFFGGENENQ